MLNASFNRKSLRAVSLTAMASVSVILTACGGGSGTGAYDTSYTVQAILSANNHILVNYLLINI